MAGLSSPTAGTSLRSFYLRAVRRFPIRLNGAADWLFNGTSFLALVLLVFNEELAREVFNWEGVSPFFAVIPAALIPTYAFLGAVYDVYREMEGRALAAEHRLRDIEDGRPKLEIVYARRPPYLEGNRRHRVAIFNASDNQANQVRLRLIDIEPHPPGLEDRILPARMGLRGGGTETSINPWQSEYFDVIALARRGGSNLAVWALTTEWGDVEVDLGANDDFIFRFEVSVAGGRPRSGSLRARKNSSGEVLIWPHQGIREEPTASL